MQPDSKTLHPHSDLRNVLLNYFSFFPMEGYFFFTAALTFAFSAGVPERETRDRAFFACVSSSIGYFRLLGSAKDLVGSAFRSAPESFAIGSPRFTNGNCNNG
jgi:hypothetical protein